VEKGERKPEKLHRIPGGGSAREPQLTRYGPRTNSRQGIKRQKVIHPENERGEEKQGKHILLHLELTWTKLLENNKGRREEGGRKGRKRE